MDGCVLYNLLSGLGSSYSNSFAVFCTETGVEKFTENCGFMESLV